MEIEVVDGSLKTLARDWRELRDGKEGAASDDDPYPKYLSEEHHRLYGRPWSIGRSYFDFLKLKGLTPSHRVLDFGCGAGRLGIWLISYLEPGRYVGIDHHWEALDAFARYEIPLHGLQSKGPRLVLDGSLNMRALGGQFDVILDCYASFHLDETQRLTLFREYSEILTREGRIFLPHDPKLTDAQLAELGFAVTEKTLVRLHHLEHYLPEKKLTDHWHIIRHA